MLLCPFEFRAILPRFSQAMPQQGHTSTVRGVNKSLAAQRKATQILAWVELHIPVMSFMTITGVENQGLDPNVN